MQSLILRNTLEPVVHAEQLIRTEIPIEERVKASIINDLTNLGWQVVHNNGSIEIIPPTEYNKDTIKRAMSIKRVEILKRNTAWINKYLSLAKRNLADGHSVLNSRIKPKIEVCETNKQHSLFQSLFPCFSLQIRMVYFHNLL